MGYVEVDPYAKRLGIECLESGLETSVCRLVVKEEHFNGVGSVHGAVIFSLADIVFACACNATEERFIGMQTEIRYMGMVKGTELLATAQLISSSKRFLHYQVTVTDGFNTKVAFFTSTAFKLGA